MFLTKKPIYYIFIISAFFSLVDVVLFAMNIHINVLASVSLMFFGVGGLICAFANKVNTKILLCCLISVLLVVVGTFPSLFFVGMLNWAVLVLPNANSTQKYIGLIAKCIIFMGVFLFVCSFAILPPVIAIAFAAFSCILNLTYCVIMIKNEEKLIND